MFTQYRRHDVKSSFATNDDVITFPLLPAFARVVYFIRVVMLELIGARFHPVFGY